MGLKKYPPKIMGTDWNNLIDFLGGETVDALLSQNKLANKFTQTEHDALPNPHHPEAHAHPDKADNPHGNTQHTVNYITTCDRLPGIPVDLGETLAEGVSNKFTREDHVHKLLVRTAQAGTLKGTRKRLNFTGAGVTVTDDPTNDELDIDIPGGGAALPSHLSFLQDGADVAWTNMPAALTEFQGLTTKRTKDELTNATQARLIVNVGVVGAANAEIRAQYSTDQSTWYYLDNVDGPKTNIATLGLKVSAWVTLVAGAKADVFLRLVGINGDGAKDPKFGGVQLQFK